MLKVQIGEIAGKVWETLGREGAQSPMGLAQTLKAEPDLIHQSVGWLARESKIEFQKRGKQYFVSLTPLEKDVYKAVRNKQGKV